MVCFEISNIEDIVKEVIRDLSPSSNDVEVNEVYNRDIEKIVGEFSYSGYDTERKILYMPRAKMKSIIGEMYKVERSRRLKEKRWAKFLMRRH